MIGWYATNVAMNTGQKETVGELIRRVRRERGLTQGQVATFAGVTRSWLSLVESGHRERPERERLEKIARVLRIPPETLLSAAGYRVTPLPERERRTLEEVLAELEAIRPLELPVEEPPLAAGAPIGAPIEVYYYSPEPGERTHVFRCFRVSGCCMEPDISPGDKVVVDTSTEWKIGDTVAAVHDGELVVKRVVKREGELWLEANDGTLVKPNGETRVIGVVVEVARRVPRGSGEQRQSELSP